MINAQESFSFSLLMKPAGTLHLRQHGSTVTMHSIVWR